MREGALRPPRVVTVDLWHTLLEVRPGSIGPLAEIRERAWTDALVRAGYPARTAPGAVRAMRSEAERIQSSGRSVPIRRQAELLAARTGAPVAPEVVARAIGEAARRARVRIAPGAARALDWVRRSGTRLGLVSNILSEPPEAIRALIERTGLSDRLEAVYLSAEHRYAKPSPRPFLEVVRTLGGRPREAVHIGDHSDDVVGARAAGLAVVRYTGLLDGYDREPARALARIPPGVPVLRSWARLPREWNRLVERARAVPRRPAPPRRGRSARAG